MDGEDSYVIHLSISGAKKRLRLLKLDKADKIKKSKFDPNVVGLDQSSDDSISESDNDEPEIVETNTIHDVTENDSPVQDGKVENSTDIEIKSAIDETRVTQGIEKGPKQDEGKSKNVEKIAKPQVKVEEKPLLSHPTVNVEVKRDPKIQVSRLKLPILGEEQRIMELINENEFLIVAGETGIHFYLF